MQEIACGSKVGGSMKATVAKEDALPALSLLSSSGVADSQPDDHRPRAAARPGVARSLLGFLRPNWGDDDGVDDVIDRAACTDPPVRAESDPCGATANAHTQLRSCAVAQLCSCSVATPHHLPFLILTLTPTLIHHPHDPPHPSTAASRVLSASSSRRREH
eukprot:1552470-Rhodomonas_salina.3